MSGASPVTPTLASAIQAALGYAAEAESALGATQAAATAAATSATNAATAAASVTGAAVTVANALASVEGIANTVLLAQQSVQGVALGVNNAVSTALDAYEATNPIQIIANDAAASATAAAGSATSAAGSVTTAAASATAAASSATAAASSATAAASSATTAGTDATNAASSASAAAASAASLTTAVTTVVGQAGAVTATQIQTGLNALSGGPTFTLNTASTGATQSVNTNSTTLATTAFVLAQASSSNPIIDSTAAPGSATTFARADHVHPSDTSRLATSGGKLTGAIGFATIASIASASTVDLGAQTSNVVSITGTTTVNSFGSTATSGSAFLVTFAGALTLTNSSSLVLPGAASITTAAGDSCFAVCKGSGNWAVSIYQPASGNALVVAPTIAQMPTDVLTASIPFLIGSPGGPVLTTGLQGWFSVAFPCTIQSVTLYADQSGSITIDIWKCTESQYAPGTHPVVGDSITSSSPPVISSASKSVNTTLSGWTTTINAGDVLAFNVKVAATNITQVSVNIKVQKT